MINNNEIKFYIEKNLIDFFLIFKNSENIDYYTNDNFCFINNKKYSWPNFILNSNISSKNLLDNIIEISKLIKTNKAPKYWAVNSDLAKEFLIEIKKQDFLPIVKWSGMYLNISNKQNFIVSKNFTIQKISNREQLKNWLKIVNEQIYKTDKLKLYFFEAALKNKSVEMYLGYYNKVPVATSLLYTSSSYSGLYMIATKDEYRKKGFGTAITIHAINKAIEVGNTKFVLHATKLGKPVYEKMGFKEYNNIYIYCKNI